jgi:uncharacterized protein YgiM (DUF1202 family)
MNKKNLQYLSLALIIAGGYYFFMKGKKSKSNGVVPMLDEPKPIDEKPKTQPQPKTPSPNFDDVAIYIVNTASGNLNIRGTASTKGIIVGTLNKGEEVKARPSSILGWSELVDNSGFFPKVKGYVSSQYLLKK